MDLTDLTAKFNALFGKEQDKISGNILNAICGSERKKIFDEIASWHENGLDTDELQKIYQYYFADREGKKQDFTPKSLARLCAELTETEDDAVCYDLCAGSGAMTIQKWAVNPNKIFICEELDEQVIPFLLINLALRNINGWVINRNALTLQTKKVYKLTRSEKYSEISEDEIPGICADEIVSNPPFNLKWEQIHDKRFSENMPPKSNANYAFVLMALSRLKDGGKCAFILPTGVLTTDPEKESRKYLSEGGKLSHVVTVPDKMFESTSIGTCVLVFDNSDCIKMTDASKFGTPEKRKQRGQFGGSAHTNRVYEKTVNVLTNVAIQRILDGSYSEIVSIDDIRANDYILTPARYSNVNSAEEPHRPYEDIMRDINRISREKSMLKITVNEKLAKEIGLYEVAELSKDNKELSEAINETFKLLGGEFKSKPYISLSKNKNELKIELTDEELFPSLLAIFMPM